MEIIQDLKKNEILKTNNFTLVFILVIIMSILLFNTFFRIQKNFNSSNGSQTLTTEPKVQQFEAIKQNKAIKSATTPSISALFIGCNGFF